MLARRAKHRYKEVRAAELTYIDEIRQEISQDGAMQSPAAKARILRYIDPARRAQLSHAPDQLAKFPRPSLLLIGAAYKELNSCKRLQARKEVAIFLGETLLPLAGIAVRPSPARATVTPGKYFQACRDAEIFFVHAYQQAQGEGDTQQRLSVYHDSARRPLAFRKSFAESSALALDDLHELIPAGTIMSVDDQYTTNPTGEYADEFFNYTTYQVDGPLAVTPSRLSTWVYPDGVDRALFAVTNDGDSYNKSRAAITVPYTIEHFRQAANHIMGLCGIAGQVAPES